MTQKKFTTSGAEVDVVWDGRLCIYVGECGRASGDRLVGGRKPWCQPDVSDVSEIIKMAKRCPTGALTWVMKDGSGTETAAGENTVTVANHEPLYVQGELSIDGAALCRCGKSKNKLFYDNSHETDGFQDRGAIGRRSRRGPQSGRPPDR